MRCFAKVRTDEAGGGGATSPQGYGAEDLAARTISLPPAASRAGRSPSSMRTDTPNAESDLGVYRGRTARALHGGQWRFVKVNQQGDPSPLPAASGTWAGEIALDIRHGERHLPELSHLAREVAPTPRSRAWARPSKWRSIWRLRGVEQLRGPEDETVIADEAYSITPSPRGRDLCGLWRRRLPLGRAIPGCGRARRRGGRHVFVPISVASPG